MKDGMPLDRRVNRILKRGFDIVASAGTLLCMLPILPVIAFKIKRESPGPIFFSQKRTGLNGKTFVCYKFRSMHINSDADLVQAVENDARLFPFGYWLRRHNVDEFPQFWNVLKGDMSIVGPRPHMLLHTEIFSQQVDHYMDRHRVKPGITGLAQATGHHGGIFSQRQIEKRVWCDLWYIEHWTFGFDLRIIWKTFRNITKRKKACG